MGGNPIVSSMIFIAAQFAAQILLGAYVIYLLTNSSN